MKSLFGPDGFVYNEGVVNTPIDCTNCSRQFVAKLDYDLTGNHVVECPYCGHEHCRVIEKGIVTGDRWDSRFGEVKAKADAAWSHKTEPIETTTAAEHIRRQWRRR